MVHSNKQIQLFIFLPYSSIKYLPYLYKFRVRIMSSVLSSTCKTCTSNLLTNIYIDQQHHFLFCLLWAKSMFWGTYSISHRPTRQTFTSNTMNGDLFRTLPDHVLFTARWQLKIYILYRYIRWYIISFYFCYLYRIIFFMFPFVVSFSFSTVQFYLFYFLLIYVYLYKFISMYTCTPWLCVQWR